MKLTKHTTAGLSSAASTARRPNAAFIVSIWLWLASFTRRITGRAFYIVTIGTCYVDVLIPNYPFHESGIRAGEERIGGAYTIRPGGSAVNFACMFWRLAKLNNLRKLKPAFIGMIGADLFGKILKLLLKEHGVHYRLVEQPGTGTNMSFNPTSPEGVDIQLTAGTANATLAPKVVAKDLNRAIARAKMLYLGGLLKLPFTQADFESIGELARRHGTRIVVDHGRIPADIDEMRREAVREFIKRYVKFYFPSREEFLALWDFDSIEAGCAWLAEQAPELFVVVKDGANGAYYWDGGAVQHEEAVPGITILNGAGIGDTCNAGMLVALASGHPLRTVVRYGCDVAAAYGTQTEPPLLKK